MRNIRDFSLGWKRGLLLSILMPALLLLGISAHALVREKNR
ncbi:MAG: hypothetical protein ACUVWV_15455 [Thermodesulfobacteriota bacterium]